MNASTIVNATTLDKEVFGNKSIFDGIYVYEHIDPEELFNVIHTAPLIDFNGTRHASSIGTLYKTERDLLTAYQYQWVNGINVFVSEWYLLKHGWGRIFPKDYLSMSIFHRPTRHTLCHKHLIDLDLVNCHYEIILSKLQQLCMECKAISEYCANVTHYRQLVATHYSVSKDSAKSLFIRILYGGCVNGWRTDNNVTIESTPKILTLIQNEMSAFIDLVWQGNQHIYNDLINERPNRFVGEYVGKDKNTVMSFWCQSIERYLQESCITYLVTKYNLRINDFIPCQDGFMMKKTDYHAEYIPEINTYIRDALAMVSRMIMKPFDERYPIGTPSMCHVFRQFDLATSDEAQWAQYLIDVCFKYTEMVATGSGKFIEAYTYNGIYWESMPIHNSEFHKGRMDMLQQWIEQKALRILSITGKVESITDLKQEHDTITKENKTLAKHHTNTFVTQMATNSKRIDEIDEIISRVVGVMNSTHKAIQRSTCLSKKSIRDNVAFLYLAKLHKSTIEWDSDPNLFAFNNRIINLATGEWVQPRKEQYIRTTCGWSWDDEYDGTRVERVRELVTSILPITPVRDYYLAFESTGLSGNKVQRVLISTGCGGNGKSLLRELKNGVVGDYGMKIPTDLLCAPIKGCVANPVIANMNGKRSLYFSEPNAGQKICSATFKELTGDNEIVGRGLYSSDTKVVMVATISGDCNTIPLFSDMSPESNNSLLRRLGIAPFITRAVSREEYDVTEDKTHLNIKQDFAENRSWMREHRQAYFIVLLEAYRRFTETPNMLDALPDECRDRALAHLNASCDIMSWVECEMEKTETIEDSEAIPLKDLYAKFKSHERYETFTKAEKRKYTQKYFIDLLENARGLGKYIKDRKEYHGGKQLTSTCLVGHRFISGASCSELESGVCYI
jgi:hypothetical protein